MIIAEIGHNWNGNLYAAKELIKAAADSGCDYVKFQLYDTDKIKKPGDTNYEELKRSELTRDMLHIFNDEAKKNDIKFMCSCFDTERLSWYLELKPTRIKIASRSINDKDLIKYARKSKVPIIASLGNWDKQELPSFKADFLFCIPRREILNYGVRNFPEKFDKYAGFSDHTIGLEYALTAIKSGARIIEKHFTFDKNAPGWDQPASATPDEFAYIVAYFNYVNMERANGRN